ncbi:hypothetical protein ACTHAM_001051 [Cellulomonas soli]|uniref:hypothetical protein n=1 Tax=Cellulomonas soli TaxID=931535 RepID=UPI003F871EF9
MAAELGSIDEARAMVAAAVDWVDEREATPGLIDLAIWVPDPTTGVTAGVLTVVLADVTPGPDPAGRWLHDIRRKPRLRGIRVLHHDTAPARVNAGPTVLELLTTADKRTGQITAQALWRIFPDDADGAIGLTVRTTELALTPALVADSELIAQGLEPLWAEA